MEWCGRGFLIFVRVVVRGVLIAFSPAVFSVGYRWIGIAASRLYPRWTVFVAAFTSRRKLFL
jgi:hypothetical protein